MGVRGWVGVLPLESQARMAVGMGCGGGSAGTAEVATGLVEEEDAGDGRDMKVTLAPFLLNLNSCCPATPNEWKVGESDGMKIFGGV